MQNLDHLKLAKQVVQRRKWFRSGLLFVVLFGACFGYLTSEWFLAHAPSYVASAEGAKLVDGTFAVKGPTIPAQRGETLMIAFGLFGMLIWPTVLVIVYLLGGWFFASRTADQSWQVETDLREAREAETQKRIASARARGDFQKFGKQS